MQASVFGGGSNSIPLSKQFAAANNFAPLGPMELEYMQAVQLQQQQQQMQMQYQQHANMIMSESASNNNMPANQATLMSESSRASTLSGSGTIPTASLSQTRRESSTQPQAQILRENSNAIQQLSRDNSLIVNKAISTPFLASTSIRNIQAIDRPSAVPMRSTPASPADIQRNNSIEIAEAIARQLKMRTESSIHSVATPPYSNQIPPPSPNDPHSLANNGKLNSFDLPVSARDDPIDPRLKLEYERAVNAFGGKKPEESDDDEGLFEKGIWGGGTSSMFLSKSSLGSRESSKEIFSGSLRNL